MSNLIQLGSFDLFEQRDSFRWKSTDRNTLVRHWRGSFDSCWASRAYRGDLAYIDLPGYAGAVALLVDDCEINPDGEAADMIITYTGALDDQTLPAPRESFTPQQDELAVERAPLWSAKFDGSAGARRKAAIEAMLKNPDDDEFGADEGSDLAAAIVEVIEDDDLYYVYQLRQEGRHTFPIWPPTFSIVTSHLEEQPVSAGGVQETPAALVMTLPPTLAWLRTGDQQIFNGTLFELTRTWIGAPAWDENLFPSV